MKARLLIFLGLWLTVFGVILSAPGCYGHNCDGGGVEYGVEAGQGRMISDTQWESNSYDEPWLPFPRQRTYFFNVAALGGRVPFSQNAELSAVEHQTDNGSNFVTGAGNIAEFNGKRVNGINVVNDTCSDYFLRLTIELPPSPPAEPSDNTTNPPTDAGTTAP